MSACEICGATENLCNHHLSYEPEILQVLCRSCHAKEHHKPDAPKAPFTTIRVEDDVFELFNKVKKGLEKQSEVVTGTPPRYTQSDVIKIVCEHYLNTVLKEEGT